MPAPARKKTPEPQRLDGAGKEPATGGPGGESVDLPVNAAGQEKEKVSLTLDKHLVNEIRAHSGGRALSTSINELLYAAVAQERLGELVDEMEQEAGAPSPEVYERILAQWFTED